MLYGGPGSGKSTLAHYLMYRLKAAGMQADLAREVVKRRAFTDPTPPDPIVGQAMLLGQQLEEELAAVKTGAIVVSDSPILLQAAYSSGTLAAATIRAAHRLEEQSPATHIFVQRDPRRFTTAGRWGTLQDAEAMDHRIRTLLDMNNFKYVAVQYGDLDSLWTHATT